MAVSRSKLFIPGVWGPFWSGTVLFAKLRVALQLLLSSLAAESFKLGSLSLHGEFWPSKLHILKEHEITLVTFF